MMQREQAGHIRDLSLSGLFILCPPPLSVGTVVDLDVCLPPLEENKLQTSGSAAISEFVLHEAEDGGCGWIIQLFH